MPKDRLGNKLAEGDVVQLQLGPHHLLGRVIQLRSGGIARIGGPRDGQNKGTVTPAEVVVVIDYAAQCAPDGVQVPGIQPVCGELTKVADPGNLTGICSKDWWEMWGKTANRLVVNVN